MTGKAADLSCLVRVQFQQCLEFGLRDVGGPVLLFSGAEGLKCDLAKNVAVVVGDDFDRSQVIAVRVLEEGLGAAALETLLLEFFENSHRYRIPKQTSAQKPSN